MGKNVRDLMTQNPRSVRPDDSVIEAARMLRDENVGSLPLVDGDRLVGIVTDRDIALRVVAEGRDPGSVSVQEIASRDPITAEATSDLDDALRLMARHQVRRLPVTEEGRLVGILAQADVAGEIGDKQTGRLVEASRSPAPESATNSPS
jgi:CBS domain-containing protein